MQSAQPRLISREERSADTSEPATPWVVEAGQQRAHADLVALLGEESETVTRRTAEHGAVLFRGFDLRTDDEFERAVLAIRGTQGIARVFMAEEGRTLVSGTRFVLHTNSIYTTGGSFELGAFHTENYFVPDVPRYIFFFCREPCPMGGETGLVNTAAVYRALPDDAKAKLAAQSYLAATYPVEQVCARYGVSVRAVEALADELGISIEEHARKRFLMLYKPSVFVHPETGERALDLHFYSGLMGLGFPAAIRAAFAPDYRGPRWALHQLLWRRPALTHLVPSLTVVRAPRVAWRNFRNLVAERAREKLGWGATDQAPAGARVHEAFAPGDGQRVARAMRAHFSSFRWRAGDLLMVDNVKMAHSGMPGFGPRLVRAMITNPISVPCRKGGPGEWAVPRATLPETVGDRLSKLATA